MLIDRSHKSWLMISAVISAVAVMAYVGVSQQSIHGATGGSLLGLTFGIIGSAFMIFALLLAVRKRLPTWRIGSAQFWLRAHLWLGSLGFLLILLHSGFGLGGLLENLLWLSFGLVVVTGFAGLALQQVIPRLLTTRVPLETMVSQIPFLSKAMLFRADQLVAKHAGPLDLPYESLKPFAEAVLQQQRVLKRETDFPKELAKVYANVPLPEGDTKKGHATEASAPPKPSPLPAGVSGPSSGAGIEHPPLVGTAPATEAPAAKPKSPLELMREKQASAKEAAAQPNAATPTTPAKSPIELMREKAAAKAAAEAKPTTDAPTAESEKKLSPVELMRAKMSAKSLPADKPADAPQPLTVEKPAAAESADPAKPAAPPVVKKPMPMAKPGTTTAPAVSATPPKPKPVVIPAAVLKEFREFHVNVVRPFLDQGRSPQQRLDDATSARRLFGQLKADLPSELHETVTQLETFCEERRQFAVQKRLHRWLHWWLILHIPPSIALFVLFIAHVVVSLRVVPFGK